MPDAPSGPAATADASGTPDTVTEAVAQLIAEGYTADYQLHGGVLRAEAGPKGVAECAVPEAVVDRMYRFEGPSDPGDEMVVFGIHDPKSGVRGSLVSAFGVAADPEVLDQLSYLASQVDSDRHGVPDSAD